MFMHKMCEVHVECSDQRIRNPINHLSMVTLDARNNFQENDTAYKLHTNLYILFYFQMQFHVGKTPVAC